MPHYKDGTPAQVGDFVKGKPYNTDHEIVGTMVQITEGTDRCNCIVAFADPVVTQIPLEKFYPDIPLPAHLTRIKGGRIDSGKPYESENVLIVPRTDSGAVKDFVKV